MKKVTIEDISRETGLSRGTVSRALNDRPDISAKTKQVVLSACQKLNYVPNHAARTLATGRSYEIALLASDLRCPFAGEVLRGAAERADQSGYVIQVREIGRSPVDALARAMKVTPDRIDGMIVVTPEPLPNGKLLRERLTPRPIVTTSTCEAAEADVLAPDRAESGRLVARHLIQAGARELLYVWRTGSSAAEERFRGFGEVCHGAGIAVREVTLEPGDPVESDPTVAEQIRSIPAAAADCDGIAAALIIAALRVGREPGRDILIAGQGNSRLAADLCGGITSTDPSGHEIGERSLTTILRRIQCERADAPQQTLVAPTLIVRRSTSPHSS